MSIGNTRTVMRRELISYFATPVAYVFIVIFLVMSAAFTFYLGGFFEREIADLEPFSAFTRGCICSWCRPWECGSGPRSASTAPSSCC